MKTIAEITEARFQIRGSRFLGLLLPVDSRETFETAFEQARQRHPLATHHCYAWRLGAESPEEFAQDDGEPSGSAGIPILNRLRAAGLTQAACIVVRYYGGTKLGKAGLIDAYGEAAGRCIEMAKPLSLLAVRRFRIAYHYPDQNLIDSWKHRYGLLEESADYLETVALTLACPKSQAGEFEKELQQAGHKLIRTEVLAESWITQKGDRSGIES